MNKEKLRRVPLVVYHEEDPDLRDDVLQITTEDRLERDVVAVAEVAIGWVEDLDEEQRELARRLVACFNACASIPTDALELGVVELLADDLRDSIKSMCNACNECETFDGRPWFIEQACDAYKRKVDLVKKLDGGA